MHWKYTIILFFACFVLLSCCNSDKKETTALKSAHSSLRAEYCLNGIWSARKDTGTFPGENDTWSDILVPGSYDEVPLLSGAQIVWYKKNLFIPKHFSRKNISLSFDSVEYRSELYVNNKLVHKNPAGFIPFDVDITDYLLSGQNNQVFLKVEDNRASNDFPKSRWNNGYREPGIVQNVWLKILPEVYTDHVKIDTSVRNMMISTRTEIENRSNEKGNFLISQYVRERGKFDTVFSLGTKEIVIDPKTCQNLIFSAKWQNPVLWGYEPYGKPFLYELVTDIIQNGKLVDRQLEVFGFREFYSSGAYYYLNGKKIFASGDSLNSVLSNRRGLQYLLKAEREANINIIRSLYYTAPSENLMEVADECGMLLRIGGNTMPDIFQNDRQIEASKKFWMAWIKRYGNHPSIVQWVLNNESCYQGIPFDPKARQIQGELSAFVKDLDPARQIIQTGDVQLMQAYKKGFKYKPEVFTIHAYGSSYIESVKKIMKDYGYDSSIPWDCDEIYPGTSIVDDPNYSPNDYLRFSGQVTDRYREIGNFYKESMKDVYKSGGAGGAPCTVYFVAYFGPLADGTMYLGPWDVKDIYAREKYPEFRKETQVVVNVPWPSFSGPSRKTLRLKPYKYEGVINWFDPERPIYKKTIVHDNVRQANAEIHKGDLPAFSKEIRPEVLIKVEQNGKPVKDALVAMNNIHEASENSVGSLTDENGTAWIVLSSAGEYEISVDYRGTSYKKNIDVKNNFLADSAGYENLQCFCIDERKVNSYHYRDSKTLVNRPSKETIQKLDQKSIVFSISSSLHPPRTIADWSFIPENGKNKSSFLKDYSITEKGLSLSSSDKLLKLPRNPEMNNPSNSFFAEFDLCPDKIEGKQYLLHSWGKNDNGFYILLDSGLLVASTHKGPERTMSKFTAPLRAGVLYHIFIQFFNSGDSGTTGNIAIYIDGKLAGTGDCKLPELWVPSNWEVGGNRFVYPQKSFIGYIKNLQLGYGFVDSETIESRFKSSLRTLFKKGKIKNIELDDGFIKDWLVAGPFPGPEKDGKFPGMDKDWFWEQGGEKNIKPELGEKILVQFHDLDIWNKVQGKYEWRLLHSKTDRIDLLKTMERPEWGLVSNPCNVVGYALCYIESDNAAKCKVGIGSDDGHKLWINGKYIGENLNRGGAVPDQNIYNVELEKGINCIILKIDQSFGGHAFFFKITPENGELKGLKIHLSKK